MNHYPHFYVAGDYTYSAAYCAACTRQLIGADPMQSYDDSLWNVSAVYDWDLDAWADSGAVCESCGMVLYEATPEPFTTREVNAFADAYIECALWSSVYEDTETGDTLPLDDSPYELSAEAVEEMFAQCSNFLSDERVIRALRKVIERTAYCIEQAGHDFWLTRNGHGAGYWDRGLGELGDDLSKYAKQEGTSDLYVSDTNTIEVN